jgi:DNA-binding NarL/FixJ family response regulator
MRFCTGSSRESIRNTGGIHLEAQKSNCARILVVEDCEPIRRTVCLLLQQITGLDVVGQACDGLEAVAKAGELRPDLILLDIGLPKQNGLLAAQQIRKLAPESKILFLSQESDPEIVQEALNLGASGYVAKMAVAKEELIAATGAALRGEQFVSGILARDVLRGLINSQKHFHFEYDPVSKILRGRFEGPVTDQSIANGDRLASLFVRDIDVRGSIADFSSATTVDLNPNSIHELAALPSVDPMGSRPRVIVAPSVLFGLAELFQRLGKGTRPNLHVVGSSYEALVLLGVVAPRFQPIEEQLPI